MDQQSNGVAVGANSQIAFRLFDANGIQKLFVDNVSGNHVTGFPNRMDTEEHTFQFPAGSDGSWEWRWTNVFTENILHLWVPEASPATYHLYGQPVVRAAAVNAMRRARHAG